MAVKLSFPRIKSNSCHMTSMAYRIFILLLLTGICPVTKSQTAGKSAIGKAKPTGFVKERLIFKGREAWVVNPVKSLPGNPWIWRAHFPDWHTGIDSILLAKGLHIAYVNTNDMFANDTAMAVWDEFYNYLTGTLHFSEKVVLEGVSRGGIYAYTWAKRHPDKVVAIYAEAPVCDIKSWPLGTTNGKGDSIQAANLLKRFGYKTIEEASQYANNPLDNLEILAKYQIPVIHTIGLNDKIVPPEENTYLLVNKYIRLGGIATVIPCISGNETLEGHHFTIDKAALIADMIMTIIMLHDN